MNRYRHLHLPVVAVAIAIVLLLGAALVQMAGGVSGALPPATDPNIQLTRAVYATNEARTWAIETAEAVQIANTTPAPKPSYVPPTLPPTPTVDPSFNGFVNPVGYQPVGGDNDYRWQNSWDGIVDGFQVEVIAGAFLGSPATPDTGLPPLGVIRVLVPDNRDLNAEYFMDNREGTLQIVSAHNHTCLDLIVVKTGRSLQFDAATRRWACSAK
jgi:hypothetical protein